MKTMSQYGVTMPVKHFVFKGGKKPSFPAYACRIEEIAGYVHDDLTIQPGPDEVACYLTKEGDYTIVFLDDSSGDYYSGVRRAVKFDQYGNLRTTFHDRKRSSIGELLAFRELSREIQLEVRQLRPERAEALTIDFSDLA